MSFDAPALLTQDPHPYKDLPWALLSFTSSEKLVTAFDHCVCQSVVTHHLCKACVSLSRIFPPLLKLAFIYLLRDARACISDHASHVIMQVACSGFNSMI